MKDKLKDKKITKILVVTGIGLALVYMGADMLKGVKKENTKPATEVVSKAEKNELPSPPTTQINSQGNKEKVELPPPPPPPSPTNIMAEVKETENSTEGIKEKTKELSSQVEKVETKVENIEKKVKKESKKKEKRKTVTKLAKVEKPSKVKKKPVRKRKAKKVQVVKSKIYEKPLKETYIYTEKKTSPETFVREVMTKANVVGTVCYKTAEMDCRLVIGAKKFKEGDKIGDLKIEKITLDSVLFKFPSGKEYLYPLKWER